MSKKALTVLLALMLAITCCLGFGCFSEETESESESKIESIEQSESEIESESKVESEIESEIESESETESESESEVEPEMVEITFTAGEGYTYSIEDCEVEIGSTVEFSVTLGADYDESVIVVKANGEEITATEGVYSIVANADVVITVEGVQKDRVAITLTAGEGYTYSIEDCEVVIGTTVEFSVTLGADYDESVIVVKANGEEITATEGVYSVVANADVVITVEGVQKDRVAITLTAGEGYTYSIEDCEVVIGTTVEFSVTLGADYDESVIVVKANGEEITATEGVYSIVANADVVITVEGVQKDRVAITLTAGEGYTYSIENGEVEIGSTVEFSVTLGADYDESEITVKANGEVLTAVEGTYSFVANANTEITVEGVEKDIVAITLTAGEGYTYSIEDCEVVIGSTVEFSVTLGADYDESVIVVKANGEEITATEGVYSVIANADVVITVEGVQKDRVAITLTAGEGYTYSIENGEVEIGSTVEFSVTLGADYDESEITVKANGEVLTAVGGTYSFVANANTEITVEGVEKDIVAITLTAGEGYTYSIEDCEVVIGTSIEFAVALEDKYNESDIVVKANGAEVALVDGKYTIVASEDIEITVEGVERNQVVIHEIFAGYDGTEGAIVNIAGKYEHSTLVQGHAKVYSSTLPLAYVTLAKYTLVRFAIYAENGTWFEIGTSGNLAFAGSSASWYEVKLVRETDKYQLYFNGEWMNFNLPLDANLNEMCMKLASSGNFYLTEVRGVEDENYVAPDGYAHGEVLVADAFVGFSGTADENVNLLGGYKKNTVVAGSNTTYGGKALVDVDMARYLQVRFSICAVDSNKYVEMGLVKNGNFSSHAFARSKWTWEEFKLVRDGEVVKIYKNGNIIDGFTIPANGNLSDIQIKFATSGTFYVSEVIGIADPNYVEKADVTFIGGEGYTYSIEDCRVEVGTSVEFSVILAENYNQSAIVVKANGEVLTADGGTYSFVANEDTEITVEGVKKNEVLVADLVVASSGTASDFINTAGGYKKSTVINGKYNVVNLVNIDLAQYTEIRFSVYCEGSKWVEMALDNTMPKPRLSTNSESWTEIVLKNEGNGVYQSYRNGVWCEFSIPVGTAFGDCVIRLGDGGVFYFSEVYGIVDPNYVAPEYANGFSRVADVPATFINGTESDFINTAGGYKKSTEVVGSNTNYGGKVMADVDLTGCTEFRFSVYCPAGKYLEVGLVSAGNYKAVNASSASWVEFRFVHEGNGQFRVYRDATDKGTITLANLNLSDLQMRVATSGTFYISEVLCK